MLVDEVGDVTITNDGATILKQLEVQHPAAKILVELSNLQDQEVGDGTTSVVIIAAELLKQANELVKSHVHPTSIISGLLLAKREACKFIADTMSIKTDSLGEEVFIQVAKTAMASKIITSHAAFFAKMCVEAVKAVKIPVPDQKGVFKYPTKSINILKAHGGSAVESTLVNGFALNCVRATQGMPTVVRNACIAMLDIDLRKTKLPMGVTVVITDPDKLEEIRKREMDITKARIDVLLNAGVNVVLTTKGIDDFAMKYFVERNAMAVRRVKKSDMRNIARACGGKVLMSLSDDKGKDSAEKSLLGFCDVVEEGKVGDGSLIFFKGCQNSKAQTIVLRGANDYMLDEVERSLHDALEVVKRCMESKSVVPGGGAVEVALSVYMESLASTMGSREQLAIAAFSQAMLVIPKTLAVNGAYDATKLIAELRSYHHASQTQEKFRDYKWTGLDLELGKVRDNFRAGVLEPTMSKIKMIRFATEAAVTVLRIDDCIRMNSKEKPSGPVDDDY